MMMNQENYSIENRKLKRQDASERNEVVGKFGEGKRFYKLNRIFARLKDTGETVIMMQLLVMNLERGLGFFCIFC